MSTESPDLPLIKRQIEAQLDDYEAAIAAYASFVIEWRSRHPVARAPEPVE